MRSGPAAAGLGSSGGDLEPRRRTTSRPGSGSRVSGRQRASGSLPHHRPRAQRRGGRMISADKPMRGCCPRLPPPAHRCSSGPAAAPGERVDPEVRAVAGGVRATPMPRCGASRSSPTAPAGAGRASGAWSPRPKRPPMRARTASTFAMILFNRCPVVSTSQECGRAARAPLGAPTPGTAGGAARGPEGPVPVLRHRSQFANPAVAFGKQVDLSVGIHT